MVIKKKNAGSLKIPYEAPLTEIVLVQSEGVMNPDSWTGDTYENRMNIYEEGEGGWDGNTKGAKGGNLWDNEDMWDD